MSIRRIIALVPALALIVPAAIAFQDDPEFQTRSLLGRELRTPPLPEEARRQMEAQLAEAEQRLKADPDDLDNLIWVGRRTAYLGLYRQSVEIFTEALKIHPDSPELLRHRGHRFITLRRIPEAVADLKRAADLTKGQPDQIEPDGQPNALNIPLSTLQTNIWYHLGLAYYLQGNFEQALAAYRQCYRLSANDDMRVAAGHWLYMILRRLNRDQEAEEILQPFHADMRIIENTAYFELLLMYKGLKSPDELWDADSESDGLRSATVGYGVGNWHLYNGRPERAREIFERIVGLPGWGAFGYIASEAELSR